MRSSSPCLVFFAARLAELGLRVFPQRNGLPIMKGWPDVSVGAEEARQRFDDHPWADGLAVVTGCGLFVVDLDRGHGDGADGIAEFGRLVTTYGRVPPGPRTRTPRGGLHLWFAAPVGMRIKSRCGKHALAPGVEIKGERSAATCPPSIKDRLEYRWLMSPYDSEIPMAPGWLIDMVREPERPTPPAVQTLRLGECDDAERERRRRYVEAAINAELRAVRGATPGTRNATLNLSAGACARLVAGEPDLAPAEGAVRAHFESAALACGLDAIEARKTIASAFKFGRANPRGVPPPKDKRRGEVEPRAAKISRSQSQNRHAEYTHDRRGAAHALLNEERHA